MPCEDLHGRQNASCMMKHCRDTKLSPENVIIMSCICKKPWNLLINRGSIMKSVYFYATNIGRIGITDNGKAVTGLFFANDEETDTSPLSVPDTANAGYACCAGCVVAQTPLIKKAAEQLYEYLGGKRKIFDVPVYLEGTDFQKAVWEALKEIPYGETRSYRQIAERIGRPKACRAVGMANNRNPVAIIVPCHRVIGADGRLVGYGGGLEIKERLLTLEKKNSGR